MAPLIKVKVINKVKGHFGHKKTKIDPNGLVNRQTGFQVVLHYCSIKGQSVKGHGHIGSYERLLCCLLVQLWHMTINEHANVGFPHVILFNSVAFNSIK